MALAAGAFSSYSAVGNREDLSDVIYRIDPTDTPFFTGIEKEPATNTFHEWQTQALAAASLANAQFEGDDNVTADAAVPTVRLGNYTQIQVKIPRVTGTQEVIDHAGRGSELDYQVSLKSKELKRDIESTLLNNQARASGAVGTARSMGGIGAWLKTNTNMAATGANPTTIGSTTRSDVAAGSLRAFTESQLKDVLQKIWTSGGDPDVIMLNGFNKQVFSTFTGRGTPMEDQASRTITAGVEVYRSDFGRLQAKPNRFMRPREVLVLQMDMWADSALNGRNLISFDLAKTGDSDRKQILIEHTLVARNEASSGGVFDLTTA